MAVTVRPQSSPLVDRSWSSTSTATRWPGRPTVAAPVVLPASEARRRAAAVEIVIPVYNEEAVLVSAVERLQAYLEERFPLPWLITIADNASTDETWGLACRLVVEFEGVQAIRLPEKGRGRALRTAWLQSPAPVVAYMDVDLSTDLDALLPLVAPLVSGHSDVAIGTRLASGSQVVRGPKREAISRTYNLLLRTALRTGFTDAQCGFKAVRADVARALVPMIEDQTWFFDTELLLLAEHNHLRIHEVPVDWVDDPDSRVHVVSTATDDLKGMWRMLRTFTAGEGRLPADDHVVARLANHRTASDGFASQLVRFASVGLVSTAVFAVLFAALRPSLGIVGADVVALAVCAVANTAAHRRLTFTRRGSAVRDRQVAGSLALGAMALAVNLAGLAVASHLGFTSTVQLVAALVTANLLAAVGRFVGLRRLFG